MASPAVLAVAADLKSTLLEGLGPIDLKNILAAARPQQFVANSVIFNQGNPAQYLYLLTKGRARHFFMTEEGRKLLLKWLLPGEIFGGRALLSKPSSYLVSVETIEDSRVLVWERSVIRRLTSHYPRLLENALFTASDYFAWYVATHVALTSYSARRRLAGVVICLAELIGQRVPGGLEFDATNEELASAANITTFTASRLLSEWQRDRTVLKRRGKILLRSPEKLILHTV
jgi:CRP/FNR family transcriptional regulator, nitrogen oxide reductase regulator